MHFPYLKSEHLQKYPNLPLSGWVGMLTFCGRGQGPELSIFLVEPIVVNLWTPSANALFLRPRTSLSKAHTYRYNDAYISFGEVTNDPKRKARLRVCQQYPFHIWTLDDPFSAVSKPVALRIDSINLLESKPKPAAEKTTRWEMWLCNDRSDAKTV